MHITNKNSNIETTAMRFFLARTFVIGVASVYITIPSHTFVIFSLLFISHLFFVGCKTSRTLWHRFHLEMANVSFDLILMWSKTEISNYSSIPNHIDRHRHPIQHIAMFAKQTIDWDIMEMTPEIS